LLSFRIPLLLISTLFIALIFGEIYETALAAFSAEPFIVLASVNTLAAAFVLRWLHKNGKLKKADLHAPYKVLLFLEKYPRVVYLPSLVVVFFILLCLCISSFIGGAVASEVPWVMWLTVLWVPVIEEVLFRAGISRFLRKIGGHMWGGYFSAILFALVHTIPSAQNFANFNVGIPLGPLFLGLACEALYICRGKILPVIMLHMVCNLSVLVFTYLDTRWFTWLRYFYL